MVQCKASLRVSPNDYVSHMAVLPSTVAIALTDSSILSLPLSLDHQNVVDHAHPNTTMAGLAPLPSTPMAIVSCDTQGRLRLWDLRAKGIQQQFDALDSSLNVTALGTSNFGEIAVGTEASPDAQVVLFDARQMKAAKPVVTYSDSHYDDVTDLEFHPTVRNRLVSGSTDGVVNLFNTSITDEDDAVIQAFNHQASIHRAGFFTDTHEAVKSLKLDDAPTRDKIFALSHMETLTVYPVGTEEELTADVENEDPNQNNNETKPVEFGDLRTAWGCQYVADYRKQHFLVGSNDDQWARLVPILDGKPQNAVTLEGGHGEEVVRCFDLWQPSGACYTGGEDGCVKLWDITGHFDEAESLTSELVKKESSSRTSSGKSSKKHTHRADPLAKKEKRSSKEKSKSK